MMIATLCQTVYARTRLLGLLSIMIPALTLTAADTEGESAETTPIANRSSKLSNISVAGREVDLMAKEHRLELLLGLRQQLGDEFEGMATQSSMGFHLQIGTGSWPYRNSPWSITVDGMFSTSDEGDVFGDQARLDTFEAYLGVNYDLQTGIHQWSLNPSIGLVVASLSDSENVSDRREAQFAGQMALRYRYRLNSHTTFGLHLVGNASRLMPMRYKKVQVLSIGLLGSIGGHF